MSALTYYRNKAKLTQGELAAKAGTSQPQIKRLEHYERTLTKTWASIIAPILNISAEELLFPPPEALEGTPDFRSLLLEKNKSIAEVANEAKVSQRTLAEVLRGRVNPKPETVERLALAIGVKSSEIRHAVGGTIAKAEADYRTRRPALERVDTYSSGGSDPGAIGHGTHVSAQLIGRTSDDPIGPLMPVLGEVAAGRFLSSDEHLDEPKFEPAPITPDPRWNKEDQYGLIVRGSSINKFAEDGDILHCVDIATASLQPMNGELVIVEQVKLNGSLRETTAKLYHKNNQGYIELRAYSNDKKWDHHIHLPSSELTQSLDDGAMIIIKAVVIGSYRFSPLRRQRLFR
jgi:transcriptional regulator with XRE-family HTH domain